MTWRDYRASPSSNLKPIYLTGEVDEQVSCALFMARVLINDLVPPIARQLLEAVGHQVIEKKYTLEELSDGVLSEYDAVMIRSATEITGPAIEGGSNGKLKVIGRAGVGGDNIDVTAATHFGIHVVNSPAASTQAVAELTIGHLLSCARMIPKAARSIRAGEWQKKSFTGHELRLSLIHI